LRVSIVFKRTLVSRCDDDSSVANPAKNINFISNHARFAYIAITIQFDIDGQQSASATVLETIPSLLRCENSKPTRKEGGLYL